MNFMSKSLSGASPIPGMVLFEILYKLFVWAVIHPLFRFILNLALTVSGYQLAFNDFIAGFLLTVPGITAAIVLIILSSIFTYIELAVLVLLSGYGRQKFHPSARFLFSEVLSSLRGLMHPSTLAFCFYVLGLLPVVGMGFSTSLLPQFSIPNFITGELQKNAWGGYLLTAAAVLVALLFLVSLFTIPAMVLQKCSFGKAFVAGLRFTRGCGKRLLGVYAGFAVLWGIFLGIPQFVFAQVFGTASIGFAKIASVFGLSWEGITLGVLLLLYRFAGLVLLPLLLHFLVGRYIAAGVPVKLSPPAAEETRLSFSPKTLQNLKMPKIPRPVRWIAAAVVLCLLMVGVLRILNRPPGLHPPVVVGHRGSAYGVENTLEALQGAIDAKAEYAEVDILLSTDGVPMVIHDSNLKRLTGENLNVHELTAEQLARLTLKQNGYEGRIPSLEEVVQYCQGKTGLAVEIKLHGQEQEDVVEKTMDVLQQYNFLDKCIFMSLEYPLIEDINTRYPQAVAGYCVYGNVGTLAPHVLMDMKIDFVVIEEAMVNSGNLYDFRGAWLPVYVWTVNDETDMRRYLELGAIGIVTDYPDMGKRVVNEYVQSATAVYLDEAEWRD